MFVHKAPPPASVHESIHNFKRNMITMSWRTIDHQYNRLPEKNLDVIEL